VGTQRSRSGRQITLAPDHLDNLEIERLPAEVQSKLSALNDLLMQGQQRMNLTAIREPAKIDQLHFVDSLAGIRAYPELSRATRAADVGSGAGFPLFPLALLTPHCNWIAIESIAKKARWIEETAAALHITNVEACSERAEDVGRGPLRETLDVVTARAVGSVVALCEVGLPLLQTGGVLLLYKTAAAMQEATGVVPVIQKLGGKLMNEYRYRLAGDEQDRVVLRIQKVSATPGIFPRAAGLPFKKPLN
jgi:16S rRNA (guanine527-N7)-methyltransferase